MDALNLSRAVARGRETNCPSIEVSDLTVTYPNGVTAMRDASFALGPGTICALVGVNGSGKSTIFKAIMGFIRPSSGEVRLCGLPVDEALKRNIVSYVPQSEEVDWNFPVLVETVVMMGRYGHMNFLRRPSRTDRMKVAEALERVGLSDYRDRQIGAVLHLLAESGILARHRANDRDRGRVVVAATASGKPGKGGQSQEQPGNSEHRYLHAEFGATLYGISAKRKP